MKIEYDGEDYEEDELNYEDLDFEKLKEIHEDGKLPEHLTWVDRYYGFGEDIVVMPLIQMLHEVGVITLHEINDITGEYLKLRRIYDAEARNAT